MRTPRSLLIVAVLSLLAASASACTCKGTADVSRTPESASATPLQIPADRSIPPSMDTARSTFGPTVAGAFYPASPSTLNEMVQRFLAAGASAAGSIDPDRRVVAIISPHAGYVYSGAVAGVAFGAIAGPSIKTVIVMGPSHRAYADQACVLDAEAYRTPIGDVPIATDLVGMLVEEGKGLVAVRPDVFEPEHSVDVQIPILKTALPNARIVPMIVPHMAEARFAALAELLFKHLSKDPTSLLVASSDLSHFFAYDTASRLDNDIMTSIEHSDTSSLLQHHDERSGPCGVAPIVVALDYLHMFGAGARVQRLKYQNSGDTAGDKSRVVGYGALALTVPKAH